MMILNLYPFDVTGPDDLIVVLNILIDKCNELEERIVELEEGDKDEHR